VAELQLSQINAGAWHVHDASGLHVGTLRLIGGLWKFKAIGYGLHGELIPGGGPLTDRHNTVFSRIDAAEITAGLLGD
jgi:hypothetical protein